jgi:hypothetical protein
MLSVIHKEFALGACLYSLYGGDIKRTTQEAHDAIGCTATRDAVNVASRLEEPTRRMARSSCRIVCKPFSTVRMR